MVQEFLSQPAVLLFVRVFLALMFAHAALSKLGHADEFYGVVRNFRVLPDPASRMVAAVLPVAELAVAAGLMIRPLAAPAAALAAALLLTFAAALAVNVLRGRTWIDCGCFRNGLKQTVSWLLVARNIGLAAAAAVVVWMLPASGPLGMQEAFVGLASGATAMLLYLSASLLGGLSASQSATSLQKVR